MIKNKKQTESEEDVNYTVKDLNISDIIPNVFDNFIITIYEDHHTIVLPSTITGTQFKAWSRGRGGIFSKDVLNYTLNKICGKYILLKDIKNTSIIRLITEEELLTFKTLNLVDGQIKDISYMILKTINEKEKLTSVKKHVKEIESTYDETIVIPTVNKVAHKDDINYHASSISLFSK